MKESKILHVTSPAPPPPPPTLHSTTVHSPAVCACKTVIQICAPPPSIPIPPAWFQPEPRHHKAVKLTVNAISELRKVEDRQYINLTQDFLVFSLSCTAS